MSLRSPKSVPVVGMEGMLERSSASWVMVRCVSSIESGWNISALWTPCRGLKVSTEAGRSSGSCDGRRVNAAVLVGSLLLFPLDGSDAPAE